MPSPTAVVFALAALGSLVVATQSEGWAVFWFLIGAIGCAGEAIALQRKEKGDTLTETVWANTTSWWVRGPLAVFMVWLTAHFVLRI
jgi:hypothetical protein